MLTEREASPSLWPGVGSDGDVLLSLIYLKYDDVDISELVLNTKQYLYDDFRSKHDLLILSMSMHLIA